ncbi:importin-7 isoform X2 [Bombyx mandarina]|uniref:Importin N-terminal domain-containing protein n=2 Tax=Bombyx TaxID=7090 RepID=A0A8R1WPD6_BOMMO|nr:importin-7 isoform X2 [Bombyx mori]XP_028032945.1 importin-7 isoform X2 [Bombyx mandarina]
MDTRKLIEILRATIDPNQRQQAEEQLSQIHKIIGFAPALLQVVMQNDVNIPVRQAGVVYLKNLITSGWQDKEREEGEPIPFNIHEQDRAMIRDIIVEAIVQAPEIIRVQLCVCLKTIIKHDFPERWTQIVDKIHIFLQNPDANSWMGALQCLYQLIKNYEYHISEKRTPLIEAMNLLLPMIYNLIVNLEPDQSVESILIQKQILKCFYALTKYILPLDLITRDAFTKWMVVLRSIMERPVPDTTLQVDEDERMELPWWKCKKWAVHTLYRLFERYGSPVNAREEYVQFAEWYLTTFTGGILDVLLRILDQYRNKIYISPRVLQQTLSYIDHCVVHSHSWKLLKPHMFAIIQDVLFPLMSYSENDEDLWENDPHEYIRIKFDIFEDYVSPVTAAQSLLISSCKKRKGMLERTMQLCMQILTCQNGEYGPRQRDGALHMVGTLNEILVKKKFYKDEIDSLLSMYVFPEFHSPLGYMRARGCWVLHCFASIRFKSEQLLFEAVRLTVDSLLNDTDLPVKVEAAIAVQMLLTSQEKVHKILEPQVKEVTSELLKVIRETENDHIANVLQKIVPMYTEQLMPMAFEITDHLATTFSKVIETDAGTDEKAITAMGLLTTMETVLNVMEDNPEIMAQLEKTVLRVVGHILHHNIIEYYEEAMTLLCNLTAKSISEDMWKVLELLYQVFEKEGFDYFTDMMPVLHNYVTVDTNAFLSNENHILAMFNMVKAVLNSDAEDESEIYAAKLLEVMVLQCAGKIDNCLPSFVELVLNRLTRKVKTSELRTMLLQVLIAILYSNPQLLFSILDKLQEAVPNASITQHFIKQWIHDTDCFMGLHDRKLCVLGICTLLDMGPQRPNLDEFIPKLLPSCLVLFDGLKRAYESRAEADDDSSSEEDDQDLDEETLSSDEDDIQEMSHEYLETLARMAVKTSNQQGVEMTAKIEDYYDSDDDDDDYEPEDAAIECYTTPLDDRDCPVDEYVKFKTTLSALSSTEPALYHALTSVLSEDQKKQLSAVFVLADQRKAQMDSRRIEQSGGYSFTVPAQVPTTFKFGS